MKGQNDNQGKEVGKGNAVGFGKTNRKVVLKPATRRRRGKASKRGSRS